MNMSSYQYNAKIECLKCRISKSLNFNLMFNNFNQSSFISTITDIRGNSTVILTTLTIKLQLVFKTLFFLRLHTLI